MRSYYYNEEKYLVINPDSGGHSLVDTLKEADALTRKYPTFRYYPMKGDIEVDDKLIAFLMWADDPD